MRALMWLAGLLLCVCVSAGDEAVGGDKVDVMESMLDKIPLLRPLSVMGLKDPRTIVQFMSTNAGKVAAGITSKWMAESNRLASAGDTAPTAGTPRLSLPSGLETEVVTHTDEWLKVLGDETMSNEFKQAVFGEKRLEVVKGVLAPSVSHKQDDNFVPASHTTLEAVRRTVGVYGIASRCLNLILALYLMLMLAKLSAFRPPGEDGDDWEERYPLDRFSERVRGVVPTFLPGFLFLMASKNELESAGDYIQEFFADPTAENKADSMFPLGDGRFFIE